MWQMKGSFVRKAPFDKLTPKQEVFGRDSGSSLLVPENNDHAMLKVTMLYSRSPFNP